MKRVFVAIALVIGLLVPASANADIILSPFSGVTFNGDAPAKKLTLGGSVTFMGTAAGLEVEFNYAPDFFGEQRGTALIADSNITTLMGNVVIGVGKGPIRPYIVGGVGLLRPRIDTSGLFTNVSASQFGLDAGGGVSIFVTERIGFRGDLRYFRRLTDPSADNDLDLTLSDFDFWRLTGGLNFKF
jgi:opacity protein-like surface antigen